MRFTILAVLLAELGCVHPAVSPFVTVTREPARECAANCAAMDMRLAAVILVMSSTGCVCEPRSAAPGASPSGGAAAAAGGAVIQAIAQQQQQQEQQQQQQQQMGARSFTPAPMPAPR